MNYLDYTKFVKKYLNTPGPITHVDPMLLLTGDRTRGNSPTQGMSVDEFLATTKPEAASVTQGRQAVTEQKKTRELQEREATWGNSTDAQIANAKKFGFKSIDEVRSYQLQNGLGSDGKIDTNGRTMRALNKKGTNTNSTSSTKTESKQGSTSPLNTNSIGWQNAKTFFYNLHKNPVAALSDALLYTADVAGLPGNTTNYLRDLQVSLPYRAKSAILGTIKTGINRLTGNGSTDWNENYQEAMANPSWITKATTIHPLVNTAANYSDAELEALAQMSGNGTHGVTNGDIKRVAGNYGGAGSIADYVSNPAKVIATTNGQMSYDPNVGLTDVFDVNTATRTAQRDNEMYSQKASDGTGGQYARLRATMPYLNMIDIMPDIFKVRTVIDKSALLK